ncbi:MAG TPA: TonB-dependent receptor, partial [Blastocatellia bacterium]|nr:TonB-dependent receptor [Blastocatellia bacterium]
MRIRAQELRTAVLLILACAVITAAQTSTGSIRGIVTDQTGAVISKATVIVRHVATNTERTILTGSEGIYIAENLQPGEYDVRVEAAGFQKQITKIDVQTGNTASADFTLPVGTQSETVSVTAEAPQLNKTDYKIDGVVGRVQIDALPLNGRNFLELAQLEPGVTVRTTANPGALANSFTQVQIAGVSGALTRISVDGANVNDRVTGGSATNFSQETVQEFQISTFNFDLSTSVTGIGSINIVSRGGTNDLHGSAFFFFRDHNLAAYPNLRRSTSNPDPFFARRQSGFSLGGPMKKDKLFWFANFEYNNQMSVSEIAHSRTFGDGGAFADTFDHIGQAPLRAKLFNVRL